MPITDPKIIEDVVFLIESSDLDSTIKEILIRDVKEHGIDDFLKEQILVYCQNIKKNADERLKHAQEALGGSSES